MKLAFGRPRTGKAHAGIALALAASLLSTLCLLSGCAASPNDGPEAFLRLNCGDSYADAEKAEKRAETTSNGRYLTTEGEVQLNSRSREISGWLSVKSSEGGGVEELLWESSNPTSDDSEDIKKIEEAIVSYLDEQYGAHSNDIFIGARMGAAGGVGEGNFYFYRKWDSAPGGPIYLGKKIGFDDDVPSDKEKDVFCLYQCDGGPVVVSTNVEEYRKAHREWYEKKMAGVYEWLGEGSDEEPEPEPTPSKDSSDFFDKDELITKIDGKSVYKVQATGNIIHFEGKYTGSGNFIVWVLDGNQDHYELVCNEIGDHVLNKSVRVLPGMTYYIQIECNYGTWTMNWTGTGGN